MILKLNQSFNDYFIEELMAMGNTSYREVYRGRMLDGELVFLTVYDLEEMPVCMDVKHIYEFELSSKLTDSIFPSFIERGKCTYEGKKVAWMATHFVDGTISSLRDIRSKGLLNALNPVYFFLDLLKGVGEVVRLTGSGGHNDLNLDSVLVAENVQPDGAVTYAPLLLDLSHASMPCSGSPTFDATRLDPVFRARETYLGRYNSRSDIFSLGVLLAYLLTEDEPFPIEGVTDNFRRAEVISESVPRINAPEELKELVHRMVCVNVSKRYLSIDAIIYDLEKFAPNWSYDRGVFLSPPFEEEKPMIQSTRRRSTERSSVGKDEIPLREEMPSYVQAPGQALRVTLEVKKGSGFKIVAGMEELKRKLYRDFIDIISNRELAATYDIVPPNLLLYGPPGTGKTYISMRLAEECQMECSVINPSDLGSIYVHGSQSMIRELFSKAENRAKKNGKGVLLIFDEFDAICPQRTPEDRSNQAGEVAELLVQLNNCFERNIFVIATTNCLDRVDRAVIRKGRIDEVIFIGMPDAECRRQIFELELTKRPHEADINTNVLAVLTDGFTSGDIAYLVKETARNTFEASLKQPELPPVKISQTMLETVIRDSSPSVSRAEVAKYEKMRDTFVRERKKERQQVGFLS